MDSDIGLLLANIVLAIASFVMMLKPEWYWRLENFWSVKNGEPTDLYRALYHIIGFVMFIAMMICLGIQLKRMIFG